MKTEAPFEQTVTIDENSVTISVPYNIQQPAEIEDEVTHEVFFGENIKRVIKTLNP